MDRGTSGITVLRHGGSQRIRSEDDFHETTDICVTSLDTTSYLSVTPVVLETLCNWYPTFRPESRPSTWSYRSREPEFFRTQNLLRWLRGDHRVHASSQHYGKC